jgi:hypothetical protein
MKLIKSLIATFAVLSLATPSYAQSAGSVLGTLENILLNGQGSNQRSNLPPTNLDSFVYQAGGMADQIYGDEGDVDIPPLNSFQKQNRINAGINGVNAAGLTTGHGSYMPDAWGADEFLMPPGEWDMTGSGSSIQIPPPGINLGQILQTGLNQATLNTTYPGSNITSNANVNGTPIAPVSPASPAPPVIAVPPVTPPVTITVPSTPLTPAITFMTNPPAWISAFGSWATQSVPYAVTQGMVPVQDSTNGQLMGWMAPGTSLTQFLNGSTGLLLPGETAQAQTMLQNLAPGSNYVVPGG